MLRQEFSLPSAIDAHRSGPLGPISRGLRFRPHLNPAGTVETIDTYVSYRHIPTRERKQSGIRLAAFHVTMCLLCRHHPKPCPLDSYMTPVAHIIGHFPPNDARPQPTSGSCDACFLAVLSPTIVTMASTLARRSGTMRVSLAMSSSYAMQTVLRGICSLRDRRTYYTTRCCELRKWWLTRKVLLNEDKHSGRWA